MTPQLHYYWDDDCVTAFSTTRHGGCSTGSYGELNVNAYCGDDVWCVRKNRQLLAHELSLADESCLVIPHQTHGTEVRVVDEAFCSLSTPLRQEQLEGVDAVVTGLSGICIGVSTADCIPLILYDARHHCAAAVHAGWRGTVARIAEKTVESMARNYGCLPSELRAVIGPGISLNNFEVGQEVYDAFLQAGFPMNRIARRYEKWHLDLPLCNRIQLEDKGLFHGHIIDAGICTYDAVDDFFSARRMGTSSGRIYTGIILR